MIHTIDQLRIPMADGTYRDYALTALLGKQYGQIVSGEGLGMPPIRILEQRGPLQHGATALDYRYDTRVLQLVISKRIACEIDLADIRWELVDLLRPSRTFAPGVCPRPIIYRKWMPGGKIVRGTDLELTAASENVLSLTGRFVHYGLRVGAIFTISGSIGDDGTYTVTAVNHDGSIDLDTAMTNTEDGVHFEFRSEPTYRDLYCITELGPAWDYVDNAGLNGYVEVLRFVASDPFWYGPEQQQSWQVEDEFDDLLFDIDYVDPGEEEGAWFGLTEGTGRWLFANPFVNASIEVPYWGHHAAEPVIQLTGPIASGLILANNDAGVSLVYNAAVAPGRVVTIDTLNLTAYDDLGNDLYLYLTGDISSFVITPDLNNERVNELEITFGGATAASRVLVAWRNRYDSI